MGVLGGGLFLMSEVPLYGAGAVARQRETAQPEHNLFWGAYMAAVLVLKKAAFRGCLTMRTTQPPRHPISREPGTFCKPRSRIWTWLQVQIFKTAEMFPAPPDMDRPSQPGPVRIRNSIL